MEMKLDYSDISFKNNGKLKLLIIVGTRPEIIRLAAVINKCRQYFDCVLAHTGQNYDYELNQVFFDDLGLRAPDAYLNAVGKDLGETIGNIISASYKHHLQQLATGMLLTLTQRPERMHLAIDSFYRHQFIQVPDISYAQSRHQLLNARHLPLVIFLVSIEHTPPLHLHHTHRCALRCRRRHAGFCHTPAEKHMKRTYQTQSYSSHTREY